MTQTEVLKKWEFGEKYEDLAMLLSGILMCGLTRPQIRFLFAYWKSIRLDPDDPLRTQSKLCFKSDELNRIYGFIPGDWQKDAQEVTKLIANTIVGIEVVKLEGQDNAVRFKPCFERYTAHMDIYAYLNGAEAVVRDDMDYGNTDFVHEHVFRFKANAETERMLLDCQDEMLKFQYWIAAVYLHYTGNVWIYMAMKRFLAAGEWIVNFQELKDYLMLDSCDNFKAIKELALDRASADFDEFSDITFTYKSYGKVNYKKWELNQIRFEIKKNPKFTDTFLLDDMDGVGSIGERINLVAQSKAYSEIYFHDVRLKQIGVENAKYKKMMDPLLEKPASAAPKPQKPSKPKKTSTAKKKGV